jgi:hypothetical protein
MTNSDNGNAVGTEVLYAVARYFGWSGYKPNEIDPIDVPAGRPHRGCGLRKRARNRVSPSCPPCMCACEGTH